MPSQALDLELMDSHRSAKPIAGVIRRTRRIGLGIELCLSGLFAAANGVGNRKKTA